MDCLAVDLEVSGSKSQSFCEEYVTPCEPLRTVIERLRTVIQRLRTVIHNGVLMMKIIFPVKSTVHERIHLYRPRICRLHLSRMIGLESIEKYWRLSDEILTCILFYGREE
ncbi:hypothetical protein CBR_g34472 [Chara braunii]|uniref:Uncharacterized protein n=1 Tax=Chara braunii TaxID=69332 RepID=A0A388LIN0_CHABU|nr:hypothetical protein CBR_g34472 [Chara braunii]|eukprot:GBG82190.1 hypothetical protein CBR_g34472 [Chara braunii]